MSWIETIFWSASTNAIDSGISVSFIQNPPVVGAPHTNAMPTSSGNDRTPISPSALEASVFDSYTWSTSVIADGLRAKTTVSCVGPIANT